MASTTDSKFMIDVKELKPGLVLFHRTDVQHNNWYCRIKLPKADRYKTISLRTPSEETASERAYDHDAEVRFKLKHDVPLFVRTFRDVAKEYLETQEARAKRGEISAARPKKVKAVLEGALDAYVGSTQVHLIGDELWGGYPAWRRVNGAGRNKRNGMREVSGELAAQIVAKDVDARRKALKSRGIDKKLDPSSVKAAAPLTERMVPFISDSTIRFEMSIFGAAMNFAVKKRYVPASQRFDERPKLKTMRRDAFTRAEYSALHARAKVWVQQATKPSSLWYRTVVYNMILLACNTGMRPSEMKNLRWRDISADKDREGREIVVLFVQGKGKSHHLVAPKSVGDYLNRIRNISKATEPDDRVFTTITGEPASSLYKHLIDDVLTYAKVREGTDGLPRSTYCFRHTYATFRLSEGVDVYILAEQMGTTVKMIEDHYGHVNTKKNANLVLQGMHNWETPSPDDDADKATRRAAAKQTNGHSNARRGRKPR